MRKTRHTEFKSRSTGRWMKGAGGTWPILSSQNALTEQHAKQKPLYLRSWEHEQSAALLSLIPSYLCLLKPIKTPGGGKRLPRLHRAFKRHAMAVNQGAVHPLRQTVRTRGGVPSSNMSWSPVGFGALEPWEGTAIQTQPVTFRLRTFQSWFTQVRVNLTIKSTPISCKPWTNWLGRWLCH